MQKARILIIDDEVSVTRSVKLNLERLGTYQVRTENQASHALQAALEFKPDLILLDVMMPEIDGGEVAAQLRADPMIGSTPIVFLTAILSKDETQGQEAVIGGLTYLAKPVNLAELTKCLEHHLRR